MRTISAPISAWHWTTEKVKELPHRKTKTPTMQLPESRLS